MSTITTSCTSRIDSVDAARTLVIFMMVFGHIPSSLNNWHEQYIGCFQLAATYVKFLPAKLGEYLSTTGSSTLAILGLHFFILIPAKVIYSLVGYDTDEINLFYALFLALLSVISGCYTYQFLTQYYPGLSVFASHLDK